jgi:hypothetical protein
MRFGLLRPEELSALQGQWERVIELVGSFKRVYWKHLLELAREWAYPRHDVRGREQMIEVMRPFAIRMLADIVRISKGHPGVLHEVSEFARQLDHDLEITLDEEFETLFPDDPLREEEWGSRENRRVAAARELAGKWASSGPTKTVKRICELEDAASSVGVTYPRYSTLLCQEIAEHTEQRLEWLRALLDNGAAGDLITPFLDKAARAGEVGWEDVVHHLLGNPSLRSMAVVVVLTIPDPPYRLLRDVLSKLEGLANLVEWNSMLGRIPEDTLALLLTHDDPKISAAAAVGEWQAEPECAVRRDLLPS